MDLLQVIVLALIQGITEFLPISSSAHLILPAQLTDWPDQGLHFDVAVHLGSLAAVAAYFRAELTGYARSAWSLAVTRRADTNVELMAKIALATVPVVVLGFLLKATVADALRNVGVIALATIVFGLALWWADRRAAGTTDETQVGYRGALLIGLAQTLALIPGTSRSGVTITAALLVGLSRQGAARFSFLLSIPTIAGAALLSGLDAAASAAVVPWVDLALGFALAAASAFACISAFVALVERTGMTPYVVYRLVLGALLLLVFVP